MKFSLSASRIQTLQKCSWLYYAKYVLKIPDTTNDGALRGSLVHIVLDVLSHKQHKKHFDIITTTGNPESSRAIKRLIDKHATKSKIDTKENREMIREMIMIALGQDFFCAGCSKLENEVRFDLENEKPYYKITGFIDKFALYPNNKAKIVDYKTSKSKYSGDELRANVQGMMYALAIKTLYKINATIQFMFLRFGRAPLQELYFDNDTLSGFQQYLAYIYEYLSDFNQIKAKSNFATESVERKWLCGSPLKDKWSCPARCKIEYYALMNKENEIIKTSRELKDLEPKYENGEKIEHFTYNGCPKMSNNEVFI